MSAARKDTTTTSTKDAVFESAATLFANGGFDGVSVDDIAKDAGVNKAMIYYHFASKAALYRDILRDMFEAVAVRVGEAVRTSAPPDDKIRAFVDAIATEAEARPHFPPIWFREIAEGGAHLDAATVGSMAAVLKSLGQILHEGAEAGRFQTVNPLLVHAGIVGPLLLYFASTSLRGRLQRGGIPGVATVSRDQVVAHVQRVALIALEGRTA